MPAQTVNLEKIQTRALSALTKILLPPSAGTKTDIVEIAHSDHMQGILDIVTACFEDTSRISFLKALATKPIVASITRGDSNTLADDQPWSNKYGSWAKIPNIWLNQYFVAKFPELTVALLSSSVKNIKGFTHQFLELGTTLKDTAPVDTRCHDKRNMKAYLDRAFTPMGLARCKAVLVDLKTRPRSDVLTNNKVGCFSAIASSDGLVRKLCWHIGRGHIATLHRL
jgi:hypothetical protein